MLTAHRRPEATPPGDHGMGPLPTHHYYTHAEGGLRS